MQFNSLNYGVFLIFTVFFYYILPARFRWALLLVASYIFYGLCNMKYVFLLFFSTSVDFFISHTIFLSPFEKRFRILVLGLSVNLGILFFFKYYNFLSENVAFLTSNQLQLPLLHLLLPVGISFYTFQSLSHTLDVFFGRREPEMHFGYYALYVSFFPQILAGPIESSMHLLPQLKEGHRLTYENISLGLKRILWGLFMKIVIANRLAVYIEPVFFNAESHGSKTLLFAVFIYALQLYADFSGYSDIAIGSARLLGFQVVENFNQPYFAKNLQDFWNRWHMSLYNWFNDYLFTPAAISKRSWGIYGVIYAIYLTFLLSGLWHGAAWTFIVWGFLHASALAFLVLTKRQRKKMADVFPKATYTAFSMVLTFFYVCFTYIFFRSDSISKAISILRSIFSFASKNFFIGDPFQLYYCLIAITFCVFAEFSKYFFPNFSLFRHPNKLVRSFSYSLILLIILLFGVLNETQFIYFQF